MSVESHLFAPESPLSSQQLGSASSASSPVQGSPNKSGERAELSKFDSYINGKAAQCESLNTSGELSTNPVSRSSCTSPPFAKHEGIAADSGENLLVIDQQELLELMQSKLSLSEEGTSQEMCQKNRPANGPGRSWKAALAQRIRITPFDTGDSNEHMMESKLLPPDLLSCEDESSPRNNDITGQMRSFNSDSVENPIDHFAQHARGKAPESVKQDEAGASFFGRVQVSSFDAARLAGTARHVSEFELRGSVDTVEQRLREEDSTGVVKYNSIFSECLFTQKEGQEDKTVEQPSSIFSTLGQAQLLSIHENLDARFGATIDGKRTPESGDERQEKSPDATNETHEQGEHSTSESCRKAAPCSFEFPDGGWECSKCQNYNFKGRKQCHRCKKPKTVKDSTGRPEHMFKPEVEKVALKAAKNKQKRMNKAKKLKEAKALLEQQAALAAENPELQGMSLQELTSQLKKMTQERAGDWACQRCGNHNFSFRHVCNKCQLTLEENDEMLMLKEKNQQKTAAFTPSTVQPLCPPANQSQVPFGNMSVDPFRPQVPAGMAGSVIHIHQHNTNCSFNSYQMPCQPQMMMSPNYQQPDGRVSAMTFADAAGPQMINPGYPQMQPQLVSRVWTPSAPQAAQWQYHQ